MQAAISCIDSAAAALSSAVTPANGCSIQDATIACILIGMGQQHNTLLTCRSGAVRMVTCAQNLDSSISGAVYAM